MDKGRPTDKPEWQPNLEIEKLLAAQGSKAADKALETGLSGWWANADENQRFAWAGLAFASVIGPLGQGIAAAAGKLFGTPAIGSAEQLAAVGWLVVIAAPVALGAFALAAGITKVPVPTLLIIAGVVAYFGGVFVAMAGIPAQLGDFYCYAELRPGGIEYEHACRVFDAQGFLTHAQGGLGSPSGSAKVLQWAVIYTADARGSVMAFAAIVAGLCSGYLVRRAND